MTVRCAVAISSSNNQFNLVALLARVARDVPIVIVADDDNRRAGLEPRLAAALAVRGFSRVHSIAIERWTLPHMQAALDAGLREAGCEIPDEIHFFAIGGRKHDAMVLRDIARARARQLTTISVYQQPLALAISNLDAVPPLHRFIRLSDLPRDRSVRLAECLACSGYAVLGGERLTEAPSLEIDDPGKRMEAWIGAVVWSEVVGKGKSSGLISETWCNLKLAPNGAKEPAIELDTLLLLRDGSALHLECKSGGGYTLKDIQSRVLQFKQAFSAESRFAICRNLAELAWNSRSQSIQDSRDFYSRVQGVEVLAFDCSGEFGKGAGPNLPPAAQAIGRLLREMTERASGPRRAA